MNVLVFEYNTTVTGHRIPYARLVADAVAEIPGVICTVAFPQRLAGSQALGEYFPSTIVPRLLHYELPAGSGNIAESRNAAMALINQVENQNPDFVLIPAGDGIAPLVTCCATTRRLFNRKFSRTSVELMLMKSEHLNSTTRGLRRVAKWLEWMLIRQGHYNRILHLDPLAWSSNPARLELCPDPVPDLKFHDQVQARVDLNLPLDQVILASVGNQNETKGVDRLLRAFYADPDANYVLLLAGPMSESIKYLLKQLSHQYGDRPTLIVRDCFLSESDFQKSIIAADAIAVPYRQTERPSGVICRALKWCRPLVGTNTGWTRWACEVLQGGIATDTSNPKIFADAIASLLANHKQYRTSALAQEFSDFNTVANFNHVWTRGIRERLGLPAPRLELSDLLKNSFALPSNV